MVSFTHANIQTEGREGWRSSGRRRTVRTTLTSRAVGRSLGGAGAHIGDDPCPLLPRHADREATPRDAGGQRRHGQDSADAGQALWPLRRLHGGQRALQLLHHLGDAAARPGETSGEEGRQELWTSWQQAPHLLRGRHEHARGELFSATGASCTSRTA